MELLCVTKNRRLLAVKGFQTLMIQNVPVARKKQTRWVFSRIYFLEFTFWKNISSCWGFSKELTFRKSFWKFEIAKSELACACAWHRSMSGRACIHVRTGALSGNIDVGEIRQTKFWKKIPEIQISENFKFWKNFFEKKKKFHKVFQNFGNPNSRNFSRKLLSGKIPMCLISHILAIKYKHHKK